MVTVTVHISIMDNDAPAFMPDRAGMETTEIGEDRDVALAAAFAIAAKFLVDQGAEISFELWSALDLWMDDDDDDDPDPEPNDVPANVIPFPSKEDQEERHAATQAA